MVESLSPADRSALNAEQAPAINMSMIGVVLLERGPGVTYDGLCTRIEERVHLLPRYRQRLEQPSLGLGMVNPVWVDDENFDVRWHVRQASLPEPCGEAELSAYVGREAGRRMDRTRPLWELHLIERVEGDRAALVVKLHHALVDGLGAVGIAAVLLDPGPEPMPFDPPEKEWSPQRAGMRDHVKRLAAAPLARARWFGLEATERLLEASPRSAAGDLKRATDLVAELARAGGAAPKLPLNQPISANRDYAMHQAELAPIKAAGKAAGGTVNDAILAAVSGMLARYLRAAGIEPDSLPRDPIALVPVSIRRDGDDAGGNRISVVFVDLPIGEPVPARRIALLNERMTKIKGSAKVAAGALAVDMTGFAPPLVSSIMARAPARGNAFNLVVSNVPGPQLTLFLGGARVLAVHPAVPLNPADQGLAVGVFSYDGTVCFGLSADRELQPPVERAATALRQSVEELVV